MIHHRKSELRPAHFAPSRLQPRERLRRGTLVNQMPVDINERGLAGLFVDHMAVPNFFVKCARNHGSGIVTFQTPL